YLIDHEEQIWKDLQETLVRYIKITRKENPDWFEDVPTVRAVSGLGKVLELQGFTILRQEHSDEAIIGLGFSCEWDPEHGFGAALHKGNVVALGQAEVSFQPDGSGMLPGILLGDQLLASEALFGPQVHERETQSDAAVARFLEVQRKELLKAAGDNKLGPAVREFTRLIAEHPGYSLNVSLDVPQPAPVVNDLMSQAMEQLIGQFGLGGPLAEASNPLKKMATNAIAPPTPIVEINCFLPGDFAMWNYSGQLRSERVESGKWPGVLQALVKQWPDGKPRPGSVAIMKFTGSKFKPVRKTPLIAAAEAAICELFGVKPSDIKPATNTTPLDHLRGGAEGVARWNALAESERANGGPYKKADLSGAVLDGANLAGLDFQKANFDGAHLKDVNLTRTKLGQATFRKAQLLEGVSTEAKFKGCDFSGADLRQAFFHMADLTNADFSGADLRGCLITFSKVQGANFATAKMEGVRFFNWTEFDETTQFPVDFVWPEKNRMEWKGKGRDPR
ncbi:MAG: pentapeptide repeat-containing protein, partial [Planctomycetaceae bacterium]|nr:pentapeptide repeat-containing protein [Planctomycetaceae bacterium]